MSPYSVVNCGSREH